MISTELDPVFETMRLSYLNRLNGKIAQIESETERVIFNKDDVEQHISVLYGSLHKLIGSAGVYGLLDISDAAGAFIDWVRLLKANPLPLSEIQKHQAGTYLQNLKQTSAGHLV